MRIVKAGLLYFVLVFVAPDLPEVRFWTTCAIDMVLQVRLMALLRPFACTKGSNLARPYGRSPTRRPRGTRREL